MTDTRTSTPQRPSGEEGATFIVTLLLTTGLSVMGASLLMLAQTETYSSMNYRMMSQARYGAESGVNRAVNFLTQTFEPPGAGTDPFANYDITASPVTLNNMPVVLSADPNKASNYQDAVKQAAFSAAAQGTLASDQTISYNTYATLVSMRTIEQYGTPGPTVIMTWQVTGTGSIAGARPAAVEVSTIVERTVTPAHTYGVFATNSGCGSLTFSGGSSTDSYDSGQMTFQSGAPVTQQYGGSVGSNGNMNVNGSGTQIYGSLSTPRSGVGNCKNGNVTAYTGGTAQVHEGMIQLSQELAYPPPVTPNPAPPTTNVSLSNSTCADLGLTAPTCTGPAGNLTIDPQGGTILFGNININNGATVHLKAGIYNVNSIGLNGNATLVIDNGPVFMNVAGAGTNQPINFNGGGISNPSYDPTQFHVLYGGTSAITVNGGSATAAMIYAPGAPITLSGGSHFYGSIVGAQVIDTGGTAVHYDRRLQDDFMVAGNYAMSAFTWKKVLGKIPEEVDRIMNQRHTETSKRAPEHRSDRGMALVVSLLLMIALSAVGAALLMLSQTETYASANYRMMSQARYGAEAGVVRAVNYLTQTYQQPGTPADPYASYNTTVSPVTWNNAPVVLSANPTKPSNYPDPAKRAAFSAAAQGTFDAGQIVTYASYATLVSMRTIQEYATNVPKVITTWQITGAGSLNGTRPATVEVSIALERAVMSAYTYSVFTTGTGCGSLRFGGNSVSDSYNSTSMTMKDGQPVTQLSGSAVGTNGNVDMDGGAQVWGSLATPRTGVGDCKSGAVTALDGNAAAVSGGLIELPQPVTFPTPAAPTPAPPTSNFDLSSATCAVLGLLGATCSGLPGNLILDPQGGTMLLGNVKMNGKTIHLRAGTYNVNSITLSGNANVVIDSGPVYLNVMGADKSTPFDSSGGSLTNMTFDPRNLQISYGGTAHVKLSGGSATAGIVYMPNADVTLTGGSDFYGAIVSATLNNNGGTHIHQDRSLANSFMVAGNYAMSAFTWRKY